MRHVISAIFIATALALGGAAHAQAPQGYPADYAKIVDAAKKEGKVVISSTTDAVAANPLIKDFEALYPGIKVEYSDLNSTELYNRFIAEAAANNGTADVIWSSAMDLQVKLVADGHAAAYASPEIKALPKWAVWKDSAYGTTYEPITFVYNKRLVPEGDVPKDHTDLLKLLNAKTDFYKGKITAYDPERSGVGYLFCNADIKDFPQAWDLFKAMGKAQAKLYTSAGAMMERVTSGEHLIAYGFRLLRTRPVEEGSQPRHHSAEGLHNGDLARRLHFQASQESERRQALPRLHSVEAWTGNYRKQSRSLFASFRR